MQIAPIPLNQIIKSSGKRTILASNRFTAKYIFIAPPESGIGTALFQKSESKRGIF
jgi:hypothetical protein